MITRTLNKIFGTKHERDMKRLRPLIESINSLEAKFRELSDEDLKAKTPHFKERVARGETLDQILPEAFATCREGARRILGMRHYDVQLIGGVVLHRGSISEMKTGEGKTLVATLPIYLNALSGKGVHLVTVNDYLVKRDAEWMGRLYNWLGLSVGTIVHERTDRERQEAYRADITYGTNNEFGFDYLRDNMKFDLADYVQRELNFAIVDECDSILIDEARTPLIISGPAEESTDKYTIVNGVIGHLQKDVHFTMEEKTRTASLTEEGNAKVESILGVENLYDPQHIELLHHIYQGLKAHHLYRRDVDYMVKNGEIIIVDEFTGRLMPGRRWSDGLHQAIEAKENVKVKNENQTLATITFQNYFRMYKKMAGMTGTADTEAVEFKKIYNLDVAVIPTNKPVTRTDRDDVVYKTEKAKFKAILDDIRERKAKGQPVLVGTVSIEKSELLSQYLRRENIGHNVLNAKHHEREAEIIAQAGRYGAVTIATNMAGRGTDILLGGNAEVMARQEGVEEDSTEFAETVARFRVQCEKEKKEVIQAGGLYIVGTERHDSRRIDNQLRGRAGRQGDPGESRFYLSLEDNLMRIFNGENIQAIMNRLNLPDDEAISARMVSRSIESAQRKVEGHNFDIRKHLLEYDDVMNQQRTVVYRLRQKILAGEGVGELIVDMMGDIVSAILESFAGENTKRENWDIEGLKTALAAQFGLNISFPDLAQLDVESINDSVAKAVKTSFDRQKQALGEHFEQIQKMILLQSIDQRWKEHLQQIDRLKEGINLRGYAQKDPLIEYKKEAFELFEKMNNMVKAETLEKVSKIQIVAPEQAEQMLRPQRELDEDSLIYAGADEVDAGGSSSLAMAMKGPAPSRLSSPGLREGASQRDSLAGLDDDEMGERKLNRAERRRLEKEKRGRR